MLADGIEVIEARLDHGLLWIDLEQPLAEAAVRHIEIRSDGSADTPSLEIEGKGTTS